MNMTVRTLKFLQIFLLTALIAACGGGGSSSNDVYLSGTVIDGYISGATVCLDVNANGKCDTGEPQTVTAADGTYKLNTQGKSTAGLNIVADIPDSAKDSDDDGKTLAQAGKSAYTMGSAADQATVITPFTTLVIGKVQSEKLTFAEAKAKVLVSLGLPADTNIQDDHVKTDNGLVRAIARQIANQLQKAQAAQTGNSSGQASDRLKLIIEALESKRIKIGTLVDDVNPLLKVPTNISSVADGKMMLYKMPNTKTGDLVTASAMVFIPKVAAPAGGRPMIVFAHGTTGVSSTCAPSTIMQAGYGYAYGDLIEVLVAQGYVVVAPDYEGRGPAAVTEGHPYLHLASAGNSMALAAVGAKKLLGTQLSGAWAMMGHSQGGHAALAGAQFSDLASQLEPTLKYKGAVAIAPASNFSLALDTMLDSISKTTEPAQLQKAYETLGTLNFYSSYIAKGSEYTIEPLVVDVVFGARLRTLHKASAGKCLDEYYTVVGDDIRSFGTSGAVTPAQYPGVIADEFRKPNVQRMLRALEPGLVRLPGNTLIVQGLADTTVLPALTNKLKALIESKKSTVTLKTYEGADHSGVIGESLNDMVGHLATIFKP